VGIKLFLCREEHSAERSTRSSLQLVSVLYYAFDRGLLSGLLLLELLYLVGAFESLKVRHSSSNNYID